MYPAVSRTAGTGREEDTVDVLVVGAGVGGLAAACGLARAGHRVRMFERRSGFGSAGAGLVLSPNGVRAAERIGPALGAAIRAEALPGTTSFRTMTSAGEVIATIDESDLPGRWGSPYVPMRRGVLHDVLRQALPGDVDIRTGARCVGLDEDGDSVTVRLADGTAVSGDVVVGADGVWSVVREHVARSAVPRFAGVTSVRGLAPASERPASAGFLTQGHGIQFFARYLRDGRLYWAATFMARAGEWPGMSTEDVRLGLAAKVGDWHPPIPSAVDRTPDRDFVVTDIHDLPSLRRWSTRRVTLLGDAAHPMVPYLGQGANAALEDAAVLGRGLGDGGAPAAALRAYERARRKRAMAMARMSRRIGAVGNWRNPMAVAARNRMMRLLAGAGKGMERWLFGYDPAAAIRPK